MADPLTAALLKEAGTAAGRTPGFPRESPAEREAARTRQVEVLRGELGDPAHGGDTPEGRAAIQREIARHEAAGGAPAPVSAPQQPAANDPLTQALMGEAQRVDALSIPGNPAPEAPVKQRGLLDRITSGFAPGSPAPLETALTMGTGLVGRIAGTVGGIGSSLASGKFGTQEGARQAQQRAAEIAEALTYQPRAEASKEFMGALGEVAQKTGLDKLQGIGPSKGMMLANVGTTARVAPQAAKAPAMQQVAQGGSVGAAGTNLIERARAAVAGASPELVASVEKQGAKITPQGVEAAERLARGERVGVKYTTGQAVQDSARISDERNGRTLPGADLLRKRFDEQPGQLATKLEEMRDTVAPDVYGTSKQAWNAQAIEGYAKKDKALLADIDAKYKSLRDANGGQIPLDAKTFVANADAALHKALRYEDVPPALRAKLDNLANKGMSFEQFESLRTYLADLGRSPDGITRSISRIVRGALEDLPMPAGSEHLKPLADAARSASRQRFAMIEADPAYRAFVKGKAKEDNFIQKYALRADTKDAQTMWRALEHDPVARQAISVSALDDLKQGAKANSEAGKFLQAGYNRNLDKLSPKLDFIFTPESKSLADDIGIVARETQTWKAGGSVNTSNSATTLLRRMALGGIETAIDAKTAGLYGLGKEWGVGVRNKMKMNDILQGERAVRLKDVK